MGANVLVRVENESLPTDTRVWAECLVLREAGYEIVWGVSPGAWMGSQTFRIP
jgi:hypothetical protein